MGVLLNLPRFLALPYPMPFYGYAMIFLKLRVCLHSMNSKLGMQISCPTKTRLNSKTRTNQDFCDSQIRGIRLIREIRVIYFI